MAETWERLLRWCNEYTQPNVFNPPLSEATGPLAAHHQLANGQALNRAIFESFHLLCAEDCIAQKTMLDDLAKTESWPATWWSFDWHPFAEDITGGLVVDRDFSAKVAAQRAKRVAREPSRESVAHGRKVFFTYLAICIVIALAVMAWSMTHG